MTARTVPEVATPEMIEAGGEAGGFNAYEGRDYTPAIWAAMLTAAPPPPSPWQGIETHDGSSDPVLIFEAPNWIDVGRLIQGDEGDKWLDAALEQTSCHAPTHWMPLPASPPPPTDERGAS